MSTKGFMSLLAGVLVLGVVIGGSFFGGFMIGKGQQAEAAVSVAPVPQPRSATSQPAGQTDRQTQGQPSPSDLQQRFRSGDMTEEEIAQARARFRSGAVGGRGGGGRWGLRGTVTGIEGNTISLETSQGPLQIAVVEETVVRLSSLGTVEDLAVGMTVTVGGQPGEDGTMQASVVSVVPEEDSNGVFGERHSAP